MTGIFVGRKNEINKLNQLLQKKTASLVVIQGRRRIGKSRLVEEFAKSHRFYHFSGLFPTDKTSHQDQLNTFARQLHLQAQVPAIQADDWEQLFWILASVTQKGRVVILLDEISWMGSKDPDFLGKLKNAWDIYFKKNPKLMLILCGSVSTWIEKNILSGTGFVGRISYRLHLGELPLEECKNFWPVSSRISAYEKLKILAVTGGIPRYLEEMQMHLSAEENIRHWCFSRGGALVHEFDEIFSDLFSHRASTYKKIIGTLASGALEIKEICSKLEISRTGFISTCLENLVQSGFVTRDHTWDLKTGHASSLSRFRLSDNYIRFYIKYIDQFKAKIEQDAFVWRSLSFLPGWETIMGLQFENLVLKNKSFIWHMLGITPDQVITDNPYFQRKTARAPGCQIDYLIQVKFGTFYVCEIKFKKKPLGMEVIREMEQKLDRFQYPAHCSVRPVLIHVNGVTEEVLAQDFFAAIIDFSQILSPAIRGA